MAYVSSDGTIGPRPWYKNMTAFFWGLLNFITIFFQTLINPSLNGRGQQYVSDYRRPGGGGGPPPPPRRKMGGFATLSSCQAPMPGGG